MINEHTINGWLTTDGYHINLSVSKPYREEFEGREVPRWTTEDEETDMMMIEDIAGNIQLFEMCGDDPVEVEIVIRRKAASR